MLAGLSRPAVTSAGALTEAVTDPEADAVNASGSAGANSAE